MTRVIRRYELTDADLQDISIDSTYIKAHKASAGAERGGSQNPKMP